MEEFDGTQFAYYDCGTKYYIRMPDTWYQVKNPKLPPAGEPVWKGGPVSERVHSKE